MPGRCQATVVMESVDSVHLELEARPHSPSIVRAVLGGVGQARALAPELLDDLRTAVSEACNNVVLHAYGDDGGPLCVDLRIAEEAIEVDVLDRGRGIRRLSPPDDAHMGLGLSVMAALADRAEFREREHGGTQVHLSFRRETGGPHRVTGASADAPGAPQLTGDLIVELPAELLGSVLAPVARGWAAIERLPVDRLAHVSSVVEAVCALAAGSVGDRVRFAITTSPSELELAVAPFAAGTLHPDGASDGLATLSGLALGVRVQTGAGWQTLLVSVALPASERAAS
ncbi:MAG: ATP-binding protein [Solirubrobacteraceae bacterium]